MKRRVSRSLVVAGSTSIVIVIFIVGLVLFLIRESTGGFLEDTDLLPRVSVSGRDAPLGAGPRTGFEASPLGELSLSVAPGQLITYDLRFETQTVLPASPGAEETASLEILGDLELLIYPSVNTATQLRGYRLSGVELHNQHGPIAPELSSELIEGLGREVLVETSARGRLEGFYFPEAMCATARNQMKSILNAIQIVLPPDDRTHWETVETDMTGRYRARYRAAFRPPDRALITKSKHSYELVRMAGEGVRRRRVRTDTNVVPTGGAQALIDVEDGSIVSCRLEAQLRIRQAGPWNDIRVRTSAALERRSRRRIRQVAELSPPELLERLHQMERSDPDRVEESEHAGTGAQESRLGDVAGGRSITELAEELSHLIASGGDRSREAYELVRSLAALIELDDENARETERLIRGEHLAGATDNFLAGALGSAGTPAAQEVLARLLKDQSLDPGLRSSCLVAFASVKNPSEDAEWALRNLADERDADGVNVNALLGLGIMADRVRDVDPARAVSIAEFLLDREEQLKAQGRLGVFLGALENSGVAESYPAIEKYLDHEDDATRAAAIAALKRMEHDGVNGHLREALGDRSPVVQLAALEAMAASPSSAEFVQDVGQTAMLATDADVRRAAIAYLGERMDDPDSAELLRRISTMDLSEDLHRLVQDFLNDTSSL